VTGSVAYVRPVPAAFTGAVTSQPVDPPLDAERAAVQHAGYIGALERGGYHVIAVPTAPDAPDSPFVEDAAVIIGERVLITRPGHPARRTETSGVAAVLADRFELETVEAPATIDGGDVLVVGRRLFVGLSGRTNRGGVDAVAALATPQGFEVVAVPVRAVLHLKSGLSAIDDQTVLWHPDACDRDALADLDVVEVPGDDPEAANVVRLADGRILVSAAHEATAGLISERGGEVVHVDVSEFGRADGGLTCLSIRRRV
jgi:dimethylargininase